MQHERVGIHAQFGDDERNSLSHEAGNEGDIAREAIELGDDHGTLARLAGCEGGSELWSPIERVGSLAGLHLSENSAISM